ncbi:MAG: hypothetical protein ACKORK_06345, partial [Gemmatimonadota bacterium]
MRLTFLLLLLVAPLSAQAQGPRFTVTFPAARSSAPIDGRVLVYLSADTTKEPRFGASDAVTTAQVTGVDVDGWRPGTPVTVDATAFGYPV